MPPGEADCRASSSGEEVEEAAALLAADEGEVVVQTREADRLLLGSDKALQIVDVSRRWRSRGRSRRKRINLAGFASRGQQSTAHEVIAIFGTAAVCRKYMLCKLEGSRGRNTLVVMVSGNTGLC